MPRPSPQRRWSRPGAANRVRPQSLLYLSWFNHAGAAFSPGNTHLIKPLPLLTEPVHVGRAHGSMFCLCGSPMPRTPFGYLVRVQGATTRRPGSTEVARSPFMNTSVGCCLGDATPRHTTAPPPHRYPHAPRCFSATCSVVCVP